MPKRGNNKRKSKQGGRSRRGGRSTTSKSTNDSSNPPPSTTTADAPPQSSQPTTTTSHATNGHSSSCPPGPHSHPHPHPHPHAHPHPSSLSSIPPHHLARGGRAPINSTQNNKFWSKQPMIGFNDVVSADEIGPFEEKKLEDVQAEPYALHSEFEWAELDLTLDQHVDELYNLLMKHYVSDEHGTFRFKYTREFLRWALCVPGYRREWHLGVRVKRNQTLCACITGIPTRVQVHDRVVDMVEINFLCVHTKLRSKRLAPLLIQEITRRVNLENVWQAVYTAGIVIPTPIARNRYYHRSLNPKKLIEIGFSRLPRRMTMPMIQRINKVASKPKTRGLREFREEDAGQVLELLMNELRKYKLFIHFTVEEVLHLFTPNDDVVYSYVVEDPNNEGVITDFVSFYIIPSSVLRNPYHTEMRQAYCYYNAYTRTPLKDLIMDALILANQVNVDVFNALDVMNNASFFDDLKFHPGDGHLQYYVYNWKSPELSAGDVAVVLL